MISLFVHKIWCVLLTKISKELFPKQSQKRSVLVAGHRTSISLEQEFWDELCLIAEKKKVSINNLISRIDKSRKSNLSSALRLFILQYLKEQNKRGAL